ncbi:MAG: tyrosine-protein phosphatase [Desulfobulbaceae bacterium]|nr:tyrosine-protein phosphatase [Desulfobulbaceae bacterium]
MKYFRNIKPLLLLLLIMLLSIPPCLAQEEPRPTSWAQPLILTGVPNFNKISDTLYRSAQPTDEGMKNLKQFGIETIVNLRSFHSDREKIANTGMAYEHIYMKAWHPEKVDVVRFLQIATNPRRTPILVHCLHGADRTGTMIAIYRIAIQGWSKEEALREMSKGGYNFHEFWINMPKWIEELDIEAIKKEAGLTDPKPQQTKDNPERE